MSYRLSEILSCDQSKCITCCGQTLEFVLCDIWSWLDEWAKRVSGEVQKIRWNSTRSGCSTTTVKINTKEMEGEGKRSEIMQIRQEVVPSQEVFVWMRGNEQRFPLLFWHCNVKREKLKEMCRLADAGLTPLLSIFTTLGVEHSFPNSSSQHAIRVYFRPVCASSRGVRTTVILNVSEMFY